MSVEDAAQAADTATTVEAVLPLLGLRIIWAREGMPVPHQRFLLSRGNLVRYEDPLMITGLAAFRRSIGLDA